MNNAKDLDYVVKESFNLLRKVLDESKEFEEGNDCRVVFIYRHARNIYQLGQDVIFLLESGRLDSCQVILRAMLEGLFKLVAAVKQPEAAIQILISELEADVERMKRLDPIECAPGIKCSTEVATNLRKEYSITSKNKWSTIECAFAADLVDKYRGDYFIFSGHSHASTGGIIMQENQVGAGHALQTLLYIVTYASGSFVQVIQTKTPQQHIDKSAQIINRVIELMESGVFNILDQGQS